MVRVIGLDIGSGYTKAYSGQQMVVFPSIYSSRMPGLWEDQTRILEGVGEKALEIAKHPTAITLYPLIDGKIQHGTYAKLAKEALRQLQVHFYEDVVLITGLPFESSKDDRDKIKSILKENLRLLEIAVYPQATGTLFNINTKSATVANIGHGTSEIAAFENLTLLGGLSEPLASDYILAALGNNIQSKYGFKPTTNNLIALVSGRISELSTFEKRTVHRSDIEDIILSAVSQLTDKLVYDIRALLAQLPPNLECYRQVVLAGGGSLISGLREAVEKELSCQVIVPSDPMFSNVLGFFEMGKRLYENP